MEALLEAPDPIALTRSMKSCDIIDQIQRRWPGRNARIMATAVLMAKWPAEVALTHGAEVVCAAKDLLVTLDCEEKYHDFYQTFLSWRSMDIDVMRSELEGARAVVQDTLARTPPEKEWAGEWERGSKLQVDLLDVADGFLEKCKNNPPLK